MRRASNPGEFVPSFLGRIQSLANAHGLLTESNWQGVELAKLVATQLLADGAVDDRVSMSGPRVSLPPQIALHLALVLHELGTNARKHGALRVPNGRVSVDWSVRSRPQPTLHLQWRETGGPPVDAATSRRAGFGTTLIDRSVRAIEGGEAQMRLDADGIGWNILLPTPFDMRPQTSSPSRAAEQRRLPVELADTTRPAKRILVVEDEPLLAMDVEAMLKDGGYRVLGPVSLMDEAMRLASRTDFDAALLDANLGGQSVDDLAAALTRRNIPFAFMTGYSRESLPRAFASAPVLGKPFDEAALLNLVKRTLSIGKGAVPMRREDRV